MNNRVLRRPMPGLSKSALMTRFADALQSKGCKLSTPEFGGTKRDLPLQFEVVFPRGATRRYSLYCWTIGHGGRTRASSEYRIQAKLKYDRDLRFRGAATILAGYYDPALDVVGRELGNKPAADMRLFVMWDAINHLRVGASSSCQVSFETLERAYLSGVASAERRCADGQFETVIAFRPEYLSRYFLLAAAGHRHVTVDKIISLGL